MARTDAEAGTPGIDPSDLEAELAQQAPVRWMGWRLRLLVAGVLAGCLGIFLLVRHVAATTALDASWRAGPAGQCVLDASGDPALQPHRGRALLAIVAADGSSLQADETLLSRSPRWTVDDGRRARLVESQRWLAQALQRGPVVLQFEGGAAVRVGPSERGFAGLGLLFWPMAGLALLLYLTGAVAWLVGPSRRNLLYLAIALCQGINLLFIGAESVPALPLPEVVVTHSLQLRMFLDLVTAAAILHAMTLHLGRVPWGRWIAAAGWAGAAAVLWTGGALPVPYWWWWAQGLTLALGAGAIAVLSWSYRLQPNPHTIVLRRFGLVAVGSVALLVVALGAAGNEAGVRQRVIEAGSVVWTVFFASLLLLLPFLSRSRQLLREFALLAGISTVATSLDLLFVAIFSLGQFASLTLSVFIALGVYAGARQWILSQLTGSSALTLERSFEALYRTAREVEARPERHAALLLRLLRELFEPLEVLRVERPLAEARVLGDGSALLVPVPPRREDGAGNEDGASTRCWVLRFAQRGRRIFTDADARLADRMAEQLRRALAYDSAVERGRSEERLRIAQDLHDDIGARLLTLMYQAQTPEMEDYLRHTLQDLKTLTRGLAAREHRLSHAVAEWKSDITQRLSAAQIELVWSFAYDRDIKLTVVQWSALTRVLRELVTNAIYHAQATRVEIVAQVDAGQLSLSVADDGTGRQPQSWSHGLGLGGVRKRVKQLGGTVRWRENGPRGIVCEVAVPSFDAPAGRARPGAEPP